MISAQDGTISIRARALKDAKRMMVFPSRFFFSFWHYIFFFFPARDEELLPLSGLGLVTCDALCRIGVPFYKTIYERLSVPPLEIRCSRAQLER